MNSGARNEAWNARGMSHVAIDFGLIVTVVGTATTPGANAQLYIQSAIFVLMSIRF